MMERGIGEEFGEKEQLLQCMLEERACKKEEAEGKAAKRKREEELAGAPKGLQGTSMRRSKGKMEGGEAREGNEKRRMGEGGADGEEAIEWMREIEKRMGEREGKALKIEARELEEMRLERELKE